MRIQTTSRFDRDYARLPRQVQARINKQLVLLLSDPRHPSLRIEKAEGHTDIWKGRISRDYRFTFTIDGVTYILRRVGTHDIYKRP